MNIYALCDPRTGAPHYVGATRKTPEERLTSHEYDLSHGGPRSAWILALRGHGSRPVVKLLEAVPTGEDWRARETFWIEELRAEGALLTNIRKGGNGAVPSYSQGARDKMANAARTAWTGRKHNEDTKARIRANTSAAMVASWARKRAMETA